MTANFNFSILSLERFNSMISARIPDFSPSALASGVEVPADAVEAAGAVVEVVAGAVGEVAEVAGAASTVGVVEVEVVAVVAAGFGAAVAGGVVAVGVGAVVVAVGGAVVDVVEVVVVVVVVWGAAPFSFEQPLIPTAIKHIVTRADVFGFFIDSTSSRRLYLQEHVLKRTSAEAMYATRNSWNSHRL
jgi:hypothetical protein